MKIMLATLCLNEIEWLPLLYEQHKDWPGLVSWCFVESADSTYMEVNPGRATPSGLSVDGTSEFLTSLAAADNRVAYIPYGVCSSSDPAQAKCYARQRYLDHSDKIKPDYLVVLDADEFYSRGDQKGLETLLHQLRSFYFRSFLFPQRHLWYPPSLIGSGRDRMGREVVGAYWAVPHCRVWKWEPRLRYASNHNWPEDRYDRYLTSSMYRTDKRFRPTVHRLLAGVKSPSCVHMGFASSLASRTAKHKYYRARGEGVADRRQMYVDCREAFENWNEGDPLPHGARVIPYTGPIPEVFDVQRSAAHPDELLATTEHAPSDPGLA